MVQKRYVVVPQCRSGYQTKHHSKLSHFHFSTDAAATLKIHGNKLALTYGITGRKKHTVYAHNSTHTFPYKMHNFISFTNSQSKCVITTAGEHITL